LSKGLKPEELSVHFEQVKAKMVTSLKKSSLPTERTEDTSTEEEQEDEAAEEQ
jgi:hypothetical protein